MVNRGRWRKRIGATLLVGAALVVTLFTAGDTLFGRRAYFVGETPLGAADWERAMRFGWFEDHATRVGNDRGPDFGGSHVVFARKEDGEYDLYRRSLTPTGLGAAEPLFELSGARNDVDPALSADGRVIVFASDRPGGHGGFDLYAAWRDGEGFTSPRNLGPRVNSESDERHPVLDSSGSLVFCSDRLTDDARLETWVCAPDATAWGAAEPLGFAGLEGAEIVAPAFEAGGRSIVFCSPGPSGDLDLFRSRRIGETWLAAEPLGDLNTTEDELDPSFSPEGGRIVFARTVPGSNGTTTHLVFAERRELVELHEGAPPIWRYLLQILAPLLIALALTYLWLKWGRLHPFIKFLILSLIAHLILMMWVDPLPSGGLDGEVGGGRSFRVRWLASPQETSAPTAARGDAVETPAIARASLAALRRPSEAATSPEASAPAAASVPRVAVAEAAPAENVEVAASRSSTRVTAAATPAAESVSPRSGADGSPASAAPSAVSGERVSGATTAKRAATAESSVGEVGAPPTTGHRRAVEVARLPAGPSAAARPAMEIPRAGPPTGSAGGGRATVGVRDGADPSPPAIAVEGTETQRVATSMDGTARSDVASGDRAGESPEAARPGPSFEPRGFSSTHEVASADGSDRPSIPRARMGTSRAQRSEDGGERTVALAGDVPSLEERAMAPAGRLEAVPAAAARRGSSDRAMARNLTRPRSSLVPRAVIARRTGRDAEDALAAPRIPLARRGADAPRAGAHEGKPAVEQADVSGPVVLEPRALRASRPASATPPGARDLKRSVTARAVPAPPDMLRRRDVAHEANEVVEARPYASRRGRAKLEAIRVSGGSDETEAAVLSGLRYLAERQRQDGGWGRPAMDEKYRDVRIGKSGLALLAFLGAGSTHRDPGEFHDVVEHAVSYLRREQDRATGHVGDGSSYSHGIATYALAEAYAMTKDTELRRPLTLAVKRILDAQHVAPGRATDGGWGYFFRDPDRSHDSFPRLSVTAWQIMALESARIGGLTVPEDALDRAREFVLRCFDPALEALRYNHDPRWLATGFPTLPGSNSAAAFVMQLLGVPADDPRLIVALDYVTERKPRFRWRRAADRNFVERCEGNLYFHYYAALAKHRRGGEAWSDWNEALKPLLLDNQAEDGSWAPISPYAEYADDTDSDRVYTTAMCVLMLEVYYRYFTPLLQSVNRDSGTGEATSRVDIVEVTGRKARRLGLRRDDTIVLVGTTHVRTVEDLKEAIADLTDRSRVPLIIRRGGRQIIRVLQGRLTGLRIEELRD